MDWLLLTAVGLTLFLRRDAALLASISRSLSTHTLAGHLLVFAILGHLAESISREQAYTLLRDPRLWIPAALVHALLWILLLRSPRAARLAPLIPTPVFVFSAGGFAWLLLNWRSWPAGWIAGLVAGLFWISAVLALTAVIRRFDFPARQFAATANLSAILLIPIQQQSSDTSGLAEQPIDWFSNVLPLAMIGVLILSSYLFHRARSARKAS